MELKVYFRGFEGWPGFLENNIITRLLKNEDKIVNSIEESNVLVLGSFINYHDVNNVLNYKGKKILYVSEPIKHFEFCKMLYFLFSNKLYDSVIGCIENNKSNKWYKYPLYQDLFDKNPDTIYNEINSFVKNANIDEKRFCTLISRHDVGGGRSKVCSLVNNYGDIDCPGALFNNMSNERVNSIGIPEFVKGYIFNICNENFGASHSGYITEKLMNCCLGGAIPIYHGKLDDIDRKIFNINRIVLIDDINNLESVKIQLDKILETKETLKAYYNQPVFEETAKETLENMKNNILEMLNSLRG